MTVYLDEVFALNGLVNYFLLRTAVGLTGGSAGRGRLALAAAFGGLYAALVQVPGLELAESLPGRALAFMGLCCLSFGWQARAWKSWLWFFGVCCAYGGLVLAAAALLHIPVLLRGGWIYYRVSARLLLLLAAGLWLLCSLLLDRFARHRGRELTRLRLTLNGRSISCTALRDNGNTLCDPVTGQPVLVARWQVAARLLPELGLTRSCFEAPWELMERLRWTAPQLKPRLIPYRAVGTEGGLLLALPMDSIRQDGKPAAAALLAFSPTELSDGGVYEALCQG